MNMSNFQILLNTLRAESIADKIYPSEESIWRYMCRQYSKAFFTPLHIVNELPIEEVVKAVYEHQLDNVEVDDNIEYLMEQIYRIEDPEYDADKEKELQEFIRQAEEEEEARLAMNKPVHKEAESNPLDMASKKTISEKTVLETEEIPPGLPKEGFLDLSYLEDSENER